MKINDIIELESPIKYKHLYNKQIIIYRDSLP